MSARLDPHALRGRLDAAVSAWRPGALVEHVAPLAGGASSLTYRARLDVGGTRDDIVVKVAPPGLDPVRNRDVLRQARIMRRLLDASTVPVPGVLFEDAGDPPDEPPLFAMTFGEGDSTEPLFDEGPAAGRDGGPALADVDARARAAARHLAGLQLTELTDADVTDETPSGPGDEVRRWGRALETVDASLAPGWIECRDALLASEPAAAPVVLTHGDYRLGNMLAVGGDIVAVIDWEIWSVGDPRLDLAWLRLNADPDAYRRVTPYRDAVPSPAALLAEYLGVPGVPTVGLGDLGWFDALARFKATATWSLILKRAGRTGDTTYADVASAVPRLLRSARRLLG